MALPSLRVLPVPLGLEFPGQLFIGQLMVWERFANDSAIAAVPDMRLRIRTRSSSRSTALPLLRKEILQSPRGERARRSGLGAVIQLPLFCGARHRVPSFVASTVCKAPPSELVPMPFAYRITPVFISFFFLRWRFRFFVIMMHLASHCNRVRGERGWNSMMSAETYIALSDIIDLGILVHLSELTPST